MKKGNLGMSSTQKTGYALQTMLKTSRHAKKDTPERVELEKGTQETSVSKRYSFEYKLEAKKGTLFKETSAKR